MAKLTCQIVRPDKLLYEGDANSVILASYTGELGVFPGHAAEISALGDGVIRINHDAREDGSTQTRVVISGGYAEIANDTVIVLATHARNSDDIEPDVVERTREAARASRDALPAGDHRRAYYEEKVAWCNLLGRAARLARCEGEGLGAPPPHLC